MTSGQFAWTDHATFDCPCGWVGDTLFRYDPEHHEPLTWSCPGCGLDHAGDFEPDDYDTEWVDYE